MLSWSHKKYVILKGENNWSSVCEGMFDLCILRKTEIISI